MFSLDKDTLDLQMEYKSISYKSVACRLCFCVFSLLFLHVPLIKGIHQLNPQNLSSTTTTAKGKKRTEKPSLIKIIYKKFIFRLYRN